ncbi:MAG: spore coat U domain-containing protein [Arenicella sp.]|jgi:spore coat protein U-like protein|nr:spore coat U domain-containing protein [Arenicella sp.]
MKNKLNQSKLKLAIVSAFALGSASLSTAGYAATAFGNMIVSADVEMSCTVNAGALDFLTYDPTAAGHNDATAVITSTCTHGGSAKITMGVGASAAAGSTNAIPLRQLHNSSDASKLPYFLYQNLGRDLVWGNTEDTGVGFTAVEGVNTETLYGRIAAGETATVGSYADSVSVTLTY